MDFLLIANFWACLLFLIHPLHCLLEVSWLPPYCFLRKNADLSTLMTKNPMKWEKASNERNLAKNAVGTFWLKPPTYHLTDKTRRKRRSSLRFAMMPLRHAFNTHWGWSYSWVWFQAYAKKNLNNEVVFLCSTYAIVNRLLCNKVIVQ